MKIKLLWPVLLLISTAMAETVYVHSAKAPLFLEPAFNAERLMVLTKGDALELIESEKRWVQVEVDGQRGWVSALLVKADPPLDQVNLIGSEEVTLEGEARRRASAVATAGATRGLTDSEDPNGISSDYRELTEMESLSISIDDLDAFAAELSEE